MSGAFDTLSHSIETYFGSSEENNLSDDICEAVMRSIIRNMRILKKIQKSECPQRAGMGISYGGKRYFENRKDLLFPSSSN